VDDVDHAARTVRLGNRPRPVPLDPASWDVLQRCLAHRQAQATGNPHVMVTRGTRARTCPASVAVLVGAAVIIVALRLRRQPARNSSPPDDPPA